MTNERTIAVLSDILSERKSQDAKWGVQNHSPLRWLAILGAEYGEACNAHLELLRGEPKHDYRRELVQVAAVAVAAIECLDRTKPNYMTKEHEHEACTECERLRLKLLRARYIIENGSIISANPDGNKVSRCVFSGTTTRELIDVLTP